MISGYVTFPRTICDKIEQVLPSALDEMGLWKKIPLTLEEKQQVVRIANSSKPAFLTLSGKEAGIPSIGFPYGVPEVTLDENGAIWVFTTTSIIASTLRGRTIYFILAFDDLGIPSERTLYISTDMAPGA